MAQDTNAVKAAYKDTLLALAKRGDRSWTGEKHQELASVLIRNTHENRESPFSEELADIVAVLFNPSREVRMRVLKRYGSKEGFSLDDKTAQYLELQLDKGEFMARLAELKDPDTQQPLIKRQERKVRGKDLEDLFV